MHSHTFTYIHIHAHTFTHSLFIWLQKITTGWQLHSLLSLSPFIRHDEHALGCLCSLQREFFPLIYSFCNHFRGRAHYPDGHYYHDDDSSSPGERKERKKWHHVRGICRDSSLSYWKWKRKPDCRAPFTRVILSNIPPQQDRRKTDKLHLQSTFPWHLETINFRVSVPSDSFSPCIPFIPTFLCFLFTTRATNDDDGFYTICLYLWICYLTQHYTTSETSTETIYRQPVLSFLLMLFRRQTVWSHDMRVQSEVKSENLRMTK